MCEEDESQSIQEVKCVKVCEDMEVCVRKCGNIEFCRSQRHTDSLRERNTPNQNREACSQRPRKDLRGRGGGRWRRS